MECAVCKSKVLDFKLKKVEDMSNFRVASAVHMGDDDNTAYIQAFALPNDGCIQDFFGHAQGASTPVARARPLPGAATKVDDKIVLRIDNVPWVRYIRMHSLFLSLNSCNTDRTSPLRLLLPG